MRLSPRYGPVMTPEQKTIHGIREAVSNGVLAEPFRPADVNTLLGTTMAYGFLAKHTEGKSGSHAAFFVRVSRGQYRLRQPE
jgi:hypothetical protein